MTGRTYTDQEVREILRRAVDRSGDGTGLNRDDLMAAASDVGIDQHAVLDAIDELDRDRELNEEIARLRSERKHSFLSSVGTWAIVNAGLFGLDWANGGGYWFYWPLGIWGTVLLLKLKGALLMSPEKERRQAERSLQATRRRRERERAQERRRESGKKLEDTIERGVEELLNAAARHVGGPPQARRPVERRGAYRVDGDSDEAPAPAGAEQRSRHRS